MHSDGVFMVSQQHGIRKGESYSILGAEAGHVQQTDTRLYDVS
jgi:hypothetical protein